MDLIKPELQRYAEQHTSPESDLLASINRETQANVMMPRMLSGHLQGRVLAMISKMIRPKAILEIGTFTGYSAICLAEGLAAGGKLITIDKNKELEEMVRRNFALANLTELIDYRLGNAVDIVPALNTRFDLVFIDADKENYSNYYDMVMDKLNLNGLVLADNVLWSGKVLDVNPDKDTEGIKAFNRKVQEDGRVENVLLPIRDGIMLIRKLSL
jgi:predicted O-methyltransferase YrrM